MNNLKKMKIGGKIIACFSVMILIIGIIGIQGYFSVYKIQNNLNEIFAVRLSGIDYLIETDRDLQQLLVAERSIIFADVTSPEFKAFIKEYETNLQQSQDRWE